MECLKERGCQVGTNTKYEKVWMVMNAMGRRVLHEST
jgi:hypothetical protein